MLRQTLTWCLFVDASPGGTAAASLERTVRVERRPVLNAPSRRAAVGCRRTPRQSNGCRPRCRFHGPHPGVSRPSREAEGSAGRLSRIQLPQGNRLVQFRSVSYRNFIFFSRLVLLHVRRSTGVGEDREMRWVGMEYRRRCVPGKRVLRCRSSTNLRTGDELPCFIV